MIWFAQNMIVTGGNTLFPGVEERLWTELRAIRPFQSDFSVLSACEWWKHVFVFEIFSSTKTPEVEF